MKDELRMFTIYERPRDYPGGFVVRGCTIKPGGTIDHDKVAQYAPTLAAARRAVPRGMFRTERHPDDDPAIREVWL